MKAIRRSSFLAGLILVILALAVMAELRAAQPSAKEIMDKAAVSAKRDHKQIFLVFGATGCSWCKILDRFLEAPEIKPIFDRYFVIAHLHLGEDAPSNPGARDVLTKYKGAGGVPYHLFLTADGTPIIDARENGNGDNIGYPAAPNEIKWFMVMLEKAAPAMTQAERSTIEAKLKAFKKPEPAPTAG